MGSNQLSPIRLGAALSLTVAIGYTLCAAAWAIWNEPALNFLNALFHGLGLGPLRVDLVPGVLDELPFFLGQVLVELGSHRLLGRIIGLVFFVGVLWFAVKRAIPKGFGWRLAALFVLGGMQGAVGWIMVMSGLEGRTEVSPYRLAAHLLFALFLMGALIWTALDLRAAARDATRRPARLTFGSLVTLGILFLQLLLGAWVAGFRAGYVSNSWPLMNDHFFPEGVDWSKGAAFAFTHDPFLLHFLHRWWAWIVVAALVVFARKVKRAGSRPASIAIHSAFGTQILLGILTVLTGVAIWLAALHQAVGALVVASTVWGAHVLGRRGK